MNKLWLCIHLGTNVSIKRKSVSIFSRPPLKGMLRSPWVIDPDPRSFWSCQMVLRIYQFCQRHSWLLQAKVVGRDLGHYNHTKWLLYWQYCAMSGSISIMQWPFVLSNVWCQDWPLWNKFWQYCAIKSTTKCWLFWDWTRKRKSWNHIWFDDSQQFTLWLVQNDQVIGKWPHVLQKYLTFFRSFGGGGVSSKQKTTQT